MSTGGAMKRAAAAVQRIEQAPSLTIRPAKLRNHILSTRDGEPPLSRISQRYRAMYHAPKHIGSAYREAQKFLQKDRIDKYNAIEETLARINNKKQQQSDASIRGLKKKLTRLEILAEINNPQVMFNFLRGKIDMNQPIYQYLARKKWASFELLRLIDRLESMHVIPDTMHTLRPSVDVKVRFPGAKRHWIEPGIILPTMVTCRVPEISIQQFTPGERLYTIAIVDPDVPNVQMDSFKTRLQYLVCNVAITPTCPISKQGQIIVPYEPIAPDKNAPNHRVSVWVFRQRGNHTIETNQEIPSRDKFDIRKFAHDNRLDVAGANMWRNKWDRQTSLVREMFHLGPGVVFDRHRVLTLK